MWQKFIDSITWPGVLTTIIFTVILICLGLLLRYTYQSFSGGTFALSALALTGVIALLGALLIFTTLINLIGLSNRDQALGLPEGSVRALLALALLGLFAILVSSVLNLRPELRKYDGLQQEDIAALRQFNPDARDIVQTQEGNSQPPKFHVEFYSAQRQVQDDFAKQMLTLVGTLMTAVISFYFGATTIRPTDDSTRMRPASVVTPQISPNTATANTATHFTITGSGLAGVTQVEAVGPSGTSPVTATDLVVVNDNQVTCTLTLTAGKWTVRIRSGTMAPADVTPEIDVRP